MAYLLIADDDDATCRGLQVLLEKEGHHTVTVNNGLDAIRSARSKRPDIIISDINMPKMNGYEVLRTLRQDPGTATVPFIFLTVNFGETHFRKGMTSGADDYLNKPFVSREIVEAVNTRLQRHQSYLKQMDELQQQLTRSIPHEIKTPLTAILGLARLLADKKTPPSPDDVAELSEHLLESAERLERLVANNLLFTKLRLAVVDQTARREYLGAPSEVNSFSLEYIAQEAAARRGRGSDLICRIKEGLVKVPVHCMKKIVEELLDNACKFSEPGSNVSFDAELTDGSFRLSVASTGQGMTNDQIAAIGPHIQFDRSRREQQGAGLGLASIQLIAALLNGRMNVMSEEEGQTIVEVEGNAVFD